jgi:hypothetical protein
MRNAMKVRDVWQVEGGSGRFGFEVAEIGNLNSCPFGPPPPCPWSVGASDSSEPSDDLIDLLPVADPYDQDEKDVIFYW